MLTIVDYGCGNPKSIQNMLKQIGTQSVISSDPDDIRKADRVILPGVGAFDQGASSLQRLGLSEALSESVLKEGVPILGICMGMQLFARRSDEGKLPGLGWIDGDVVAFDKTCLSTRDKIPHMGWADLSVATDTPLLKGFHDVPRFYFTHSYHMKCDREENVAATANHSYPFCAAVEVDNIFGVQFHPEKSHKFGMTLLSNFANCKIGS